MEARGCDGTSPRRNGGPGDRSLSRRWGEGGSGVCLSHKQSQPFVTPSWSSQDKELVSCQLPPRCCAAGLRRNSLGLGLRRSPINGLEHSLADLQQRKTSPRESLEKRHGQRDLCVTTCRVRTKAWWHFPGGHLRRPPPPPKLSECRMPMGKNITFLSN